MNDVCQYVDVFYGNGETDRFFDDGLASKWFYIKALCGNTTPHAVLPFGKMSVGAYSGGYPTGYGIHYPNSCGGIQKIGSTQLVKGFSHLHQTGTGAMQYYYNYALTTPYYGNSPSKEGKTLICEDGRPGYYKAVIDDISCELTVDGEVAVHRYIFGSDNGHVMVDFSNDGLDKIFGDRFYACVKDIKAEFCSKCEAVFSGVFSGVRLYFCVKAECNDTSVHVLEDENDLPIGVSFDFTGNRIVLRVGYSTLSADAAKNAVRGSVATFDEAVAKAETLWERYLSAIRIQTDDEELKRKFYSNLYHSLIKPCDMTGENVLGVAGDTVTDLATLWDQYKTALPLIYFCYSEMGEKIVNGIVNISRTLGKIPCSFGLSEIFPCEEQAKMLGVLSLCDAYYMGIESAKVDVIEECVERELAREDYDSFLKDGYFERYTHILDATDACLDVADITTNFELKSRLLELAQFWRNAYAEDGILSDNSKYYEGDRYTYSFRIQKNMEERVALAGGKERFASMLDSFFGFNGERVKQLTYIGANKEISQSKHHRFEGFNNECDMETPYAYIYADRHDRLCDILYECVHRSFGTGRGGLPGNNDSGGLSSLFVWNTLGIFPVSGTGSFLIGSPQVEAADIDLSNGKVLHIRVNRANKKQIYVDYVMWNGACVSSYEILTKELMRGGLLEFFMK